MTNEKYYKGIKNLVQYRDFITCFGDRIRKGTFFVVTSRTKITDSTTKFFNGVTSPYHISFCTIF